MSLVEFIPGQVWLKEYPVHYAGCDFNSRMAVVRVSDTDLLLHSPCDIDSATKGAISSLGRVAYIVAPGSYHYFHVPSAQTAFPNAETYICPGRTVVQISRGDCLRTWRLTANGTDFMSGMEGAIVSSLLFISCGSSDLRFTPRKTAPGVSGGCTFLNLVLELATG